MNYDLCSIGREFDSWVCTAGLVLECMMVYGQVNHLGM